jgi:mono/diheme cytochrome c family protein
VRNVGVRIRFLFPFLAIACGLVSFPCRSLAADAKAAAGAILFRDRGCSYCHGAAGLGTERGPSLAKVRKKLKAPQIAQQIQHGGQKMPPFGGSLSADEVTQLVSYLRAKHRPVPPPKPVSLPLSNPVQ